MTAPRTLPPVALLRKMFAYEPDSGRLLWKISPHHRVKAGAEVGCIAANGYRHCLLARRDLLVHRVIWKIVTGGDPQSQIDHINGIKSDNRIANLRLATASQNAINRGAPRSNTSGFKGVVYLKNQRCWWASIRVDGRTLSLKTHKTKNAANRARLAAERKFFGEFARAP